MWNRLTRNPFLTLFVATLVALCHGQPPATANATETAQAEAAEATPSEAVEVTAAETVVSIDEIVKQWMGIADVVLTRHVDPPTRQELLKTSLQFVYALAKQDPPAGLANRISRLAGDDELREFLRATLDVVAAEKQLAGGKLRVVLLRGLLAKVSDAQGLIPLEEFYVQQQLRDNRYVGIGIQLAMKDHYPTMNIVFPHGPAWNAGGRDGDQMILIDGIEGKDMPLVRVIQLLRGQEGKPTTVIVRRPGSDQTRTLNMVRGVVPFDTVHGVGRDEEQQWQYRAAGDPRVAYLKIESIRGSTPSELRQIAGKLHASDCRALVLDLRGTQSGELRYAVMVADMLLGEGPIGQVLDARGRHQFDSSADQLFPGWPMAVLVDRRTSGQAEWIAAALQDGGRATLMGTPTAADPFIREPVELPHGMGGVRLTTGILFRREGKPIAIAGQFAIGPAGPQRMRIRDADGRFVPAPTARRDGVLPDREVATPQLASDAVKLLMEQLGTAGG